MNTNTDNKSVPLENPLLEVWRIKDEIAAEYNGDLDRFFRDLHAMEERRRARGAPSEKTAA